MEIFQTIDATFGDNHPYWQLNQKIKDMKRVTLLLIIIGILSSCAKDGFTQISNEITGKWSWIQSTGGIAGVTMTPETENQEITIEFTSTTFRKYINGNLDAEMTYRIDHDNSIYSSEKTYIIIYENDWKQSIQLKGNKLILNDECYDCFQNEYVKE